MGIPVTVFGQKSEQSPEQVVGSLMFISRAYNVGYALGYTMEQIDAMPGSELLRFIRLAREVVTGERQTEEHRQLAAHMSTAEYAAKEPA